MVKVALVVELVKALAVPDLILLALVILAISLAIFLVKAVNRGLIQLHHNVAKIWIIN
jgi:hypothetical protein